MTTFYEIQEHCQSFGTLQRLDQVQGVGHFMLFGTFNSGVGGSPTNVVV